MDEEIRVHPPWLLISPANSSVYRQITKKQLKKLCKVCSQDNVLQFIQMQSCIMTNKHKDQVSLRLLYSVDKSDFCQVTISNILRLLLKQQGSNQCNLDQVRIIHPFMADTITMTALQMFMLFCHSFMLTMPQQISPVQTVGFEIFYQLPATAENTASLESIMKYMKDCNRVHENLAKERLKIRRGMTQQLVNGQNPVIVKLNNGSQVRKLTNLSRIYIQPQKWDNPHNLPQLHLVQEKGWLFTDLVHRQPILVILNMLCPLLQQEEYITVEGDQTSSVVVRQLTPPAGNRWSGYASDKIQLLKQAIKCCKKYSSIVVELVDSAANQSYNFLLIWLACSYHNLSVNVRQNRQKLNQSTVEMIRLLSQRKSPEQIQPLLTYYDRFRLSNRMDICLADYLLDFSYA